MPAKLFNRNFTLLWLGQSVSQLGNGAGFIAVMWWIQTTTGSALALGTLAMIQTLVSIGISPFAGVFADRYNRKNIIIFTDLLRGLIYCVLAWLATTNSLTLPVLFLAAATAAACSQFFYPAISASIPLLVPKKDLERANSLNQVSVNLVNIMGFAAGGIMVAVLGIPALLLVNGLSFILSAFSETFIQLPALVKPKSAAGIKSFLKDIGAGFKYIRANTVLFRIMQVAMVLNFFYAPYFILLPKFVNEFMSAGSAVYGFLLSGQMIGALLATLLMSLTPIIRNNPAIIRWSLVIQAGLFLTLPFLPSQHWYLHIAVFALGGVFNAIINVSFNSLIQRATDPAHMGKVFGMLNTMSQGLQPLSQGLSGLLADFIRLPVIYTVCSVACCLGGVQFATIPGIRGFIANGKSEEAPPAEPVLVEA